MGKGTRYNAFKQEAVNQVVVGQTDNLLNKTTFS